MQEEKFHDFVVCIHLVCEIRHGPNVNKKMKISFQKKNSVGLNI